MKQNKAFAQAFWLATLLTLSACGGGGGGSSPAPAPAPAPAPSPTPAPAPSPAPAPAPEPEPVLADNEVLLKIGDVAKNVISGKADVCNDAGVCITVDKVHFDTGSTGVRILTTALPAGHVESFKENGSTVTVCRNFGSGTTWGDVGFAKIKIGRVETARIAIQLINQRESAAPAPAGLCSTGSTNTAFKTSAATAIIGIGTGSVGGGTYYTCGDTVCTGRKVDDTDPLNVPNPIPNLVTDNNGIVVDIPNIPAGGAKNVRGRMYLGIGTRDNNTMPGSPTVMQTSANNVLGEISGTNYNVFFDTGANFIFLQRSDLPRCPIYQSYYCYQTMQDIGVVAKSRLDGSIIKPLGVELGDAQTLITNGNTALSGVAFAMGSNSIVLGTPYFFGKRIAFGVTNKTTPIGTGPFVAF